MSVLFKHGLSARMSASPKPCEKEAVRLHIAGKQLHTRLLHFAGQILLHGITACINKRFGRYSQTGSARKGKLSKIHCTMSSFSARLMVQVL